MEKFTLLTSKNSAILKKIIASTQPQIAKTIKHIKLIEILENLSNIKLIPSIIQEKKIDAILISSKSAIEVLTDKEINLLCKLPLFCVGYDTAEYAKNKGFSDITYGRNSMSSLKDTDQKREQKITNILYLSANIISDPKFNDYFPNIKTHRLEIYYIKKFEKMPSWLINMIINHQIKTIIFTSLISSTNFFYLLQKYQASTEHIRNIRFACLSPRIASDLTKYNLNYVDIIPNNADSVSQNIINYLISTS